MAKTGLPVLFHGPGTGVLPDRATKVDIRPLAEHAITTILLVAGNNVVPDLEFGNAFSNRLNNT